MNCLSRTACIALLLFSLDAGELPAASNIAFIHTTDGNNVARDSHITIVDHPLTNGKPDQLVFVSQIYGQYNPHQVGAWYYQGKWTIYNQDREKMPTGTKFSVLSLDPRQTTNAFQHRAIPQTTSGSHLTVIDHPLTNGKPDAFLLVTPVYGLYDTNPIGVWYNGTKWTVFHQNRAPMKENSLFNVLVLQPGANHIAGESATASVHRATPASLTPNMPWVTNTTNTEEDAIPLITQYYGQAGVYNDHVPALWYARNWTVFNQDRAKLPANAEFNLLAITVEPAPSNPTPRDLPPENPPPTAKPINLTGTWKADVTGWTSTVTHRGNSFTAKLQGDGSWTSITAAVSGNLISGSVTYKKKRPRVQAVNGQVLDDNTITWNTGAVWRRQ